VPAGTVRYWSWLFAAPACRAPLLGIYALGAEWQALMHPAAESSAARLKLAWWQEEMQRLAAGSPVHPISRYLAALPGASAVDFSPLQSAVNAAASQVSGVPLERGGDLEPHARLLWGNPLLLASQLAAAAAGDPDAVRRAGIDAPMLAGIRHCSAALAAAEYLAKAIRDYRQDARIGRIPFAVDELMAAGVENADLAADTAPAHLQSYLGGLHRRAADYFDTAAEALPPAQRSPHRHLLVRAALGREHLRQAAERREPGRPRPRLRWRLRDMLRAWTVARRAQRDNGDL
jgi:phytoene synthase